MKITREMIPEGRENAVSRKTLCILTGQSDREVRRQIADLRAEDDGSDMLIVSTSRRGHGYFRSGDVQEISSFIADMKSRIKKIMRAIRVAETVVNRLQKREMYGEGWG